MLNINEAYEKAVTYFKKNNDYSIACALDAGTHWIFYPGKPDVVEVGSKGIKIEKKSGLIEDFILPDDENFELLDRAEKVDIP